MEWKSVTVPLVGGLSIEINSRQAALDTMLALQLAVSELRIILYPPPPKGPLDDWLPLGTTFPMDKLDD